MERRMSVEITELVNREVAKARRLREVYTDTKGVVRFRGNAVVEWLFKNGRIDLNTIPCHSLPSKDVAEFWQMLGYSVSGYGDLDFIDRMTVEQADKEAELVQVRIPKPDPEEAE
jgi:hypothetical protein